MISHIFDLDIFKILTVFSLSSGSRFRRNEIKQKTFLNNVPLDNALLRLVKSEVVRKEGKIYSANFENNSSKIVLDIVLKQYKFIKEIPLSVYFLLLDFISVAKTNGGDIYLFGSYSKLIYKEGSDIDIAVIGRSFDKRLIEKIVRKLEDRYKHNIEVHYFDKDRFYKNKKDPLVKDILRNGVKLV